MLTLVSILLGLGALAVTPREEEPQIVVPMADVFVSAPGLSAEQIEQQISSRLERIVDQIDGVEYVYSMSRPGQAVITARFYVGEDREDSLLKLHTKISSYIDEAPTGVQAWVIKPVEVDDVPIVTLTLWSRRQDVSDYELRRLAEQTQNELKAVPQTNRVTVVGGRPRQIRVEIDPIRLAARNTSALQVAQALRAGNVNLPVGRFEQQNTEFVVEAGTFVRDALELENLVVNVAGGRPVYLKDVADVMDGPAEATSYTWIGFGPAAVESTAPREHVTAEQLKARQASPSASVYPAVTIAVAKRKGSNAVWVAQAIEKRMEDLAGQILPAGVYYRITRDYGETADEKVNELIEALVVAVLTVIGLIWLTMGWRAAAVVALAVPVCYSITLSVNYLAGYTINRVTMFALILALGLLVDDPITDVENISRYFTMRVLPPRESVLHAVQEVRPALIMSVLAIIASFIPMAFITGMMGPYMAPMALNVPVALLTSLLISLVVTPWMAMYALRGTASSSLEGGGFDLTQRPVYRLSRAVFAPILRYRAAAWGVVATTALLFVGSLFLPGLRVIPLKMLPLDNKNEFQVVIDMPEGTTLETTDAAARRIGEYLASLREVRDFQIYTGLSSPMDFNGMVRHYFLRQGSNVADIRVNLLHKDHRPQQSHEMILRIRNDIAALARETGANVKLVEVPPGPPVISTITAEVYGPPDATYDQLIAVSKQVEARMLREPGVVDVDISGEADQPKLVFVTDQPKAALSGVTKEDVAQLLQLALSGYPATHLQIPSEVNPLQVVLRLRRSERSSEDDLRSLYLQGRMGQMVQLGALGNFATTHPDGRPIFEDKMIYRKNLQRVAYVYGEVAGRAPADAILDMEVDRASPAEIAADRAAGPARIRPVESRTWFQPGGGDLWSLPEGFRVVWNGEGELKITIEVFRDLGIGFGAALIAIFILLMFETQSRALPLIIMLAIPLTVIGIMPGFLLLNWIVNRPIDGFPNPVFFTATAMIGMIGLAGIVVRSSVVLIDFIHHGLADGLDLREAIVRSVAVRTRPILLTSGTTLLGNWVITLDPMFSGLAWAIIFGIFASTLFTLVVIPTVYWLLYARSGGASKAAKQPENADAGRV
ncbi:MAG: efflux RND transporter permease subunit [Thermogutta sp.]|nr:efflux RND transporter permease subunit [Thermogutta sp.]